MIGLHYSVCQILKRPSPALGADAYPITITKGIAMPDKSKRDRTIANQHPSNIWSRRDFLAKAGLGVGAFAAWQALAWPLPAHGKSQPAQLSGVVVDYRKCTGCRTCETVCSAQNHPVKIGGETWPGLGNPNLANIKVMSFNPPVALPNLCALCPDSPCVAACPVEPDAKTGRRALYRQPRSGTIANDPKRCTSCGSCSQACAEKRIGIIKPDPKTGRPMRLCNLCGGEPQCVALCPYGALSLQTVDTKRPHYGQPPRKVAQVLAQEMYGAISAGGAN